MQTLIAGNADVNAVDESGSTALHWGVRGGNAMIVSHLIKAGTAILLKNGHGKTALDLVRACVQEMGGGGRRLFRFQSTFPHFLNMLLFLFPKI